VGVPLPYGSAGRFRPALPSLVPPLTSRPDIGSGLNLVASPLLGSGTLFAADRTLGLVCLDAMTGKQRWSYATRRGWGECLLDGDRVITTPRPGKLAVLDQASGSVLDESDADGILVRSALVDNNRVTGPLSNGRLAAWDLARHDFAWRRSSAVRADAPVAAADGVLVAVEDQALVACDLSSGEDRWRFDVAELGRHETVDDLVDGQVATHVIARAGLAWAGLTRGSVAAVGLDDGRLRWHVQLGFTIGFALDLAASDSLVVLLDDELVVIDPATGEQYRRLPIQWPGPVQPPFSSLSLSVGYGWFADRQGRFMAIDLDHGRVFHQADIAAFVHEPPLIGDHAAYVTDFDGRLHTYLAEGQPAN
jgi:outer membrane protein assembly factor BamB